jgi:HAD superfamily hydrolase (TIGR01549 family)
MEQGEAEYQSWWSVYKFWRKYMKEGKASFPSESAFPRIKIIPVRRYAIRTFDWVPDIKAILWDLDGTLYKDNPELREAFDVPCIQAYVQAKGMSQKQGTEDFWKTYGELHSKTKTLNAAGLDGPAIVSQVAASMDYTKLLKKDKRLERLILSLPHLDHYIVTNAGKQETEIKLKALGLSENLFRQIIPTYDTPYLKPDPRLFSWVIKNIGLKKTQVLTVGDREETDIVSAKKAGIRTCYVWGVSKEADVSMPKVYEVGELFGVFV